MKVRLNSRITLLNKYLFPTVWFGFLLFFMWKAPQSTNDPMKQWIFTLAPLPMAAFGYFLMRRMLFGLADEVWRDGHRFYCRSGSKRATFDLTDIQSALYYTQTQPQKCVLQLRRQTDLGREVQFIPKIGLNIFKYNQDVEHLLDEVDQQNQRSTQ